jgi:hypothetical protein
MQNIRVKTELYGNTSLSGCNFKVKTKKNWKFNSLKKNKDDEI